MVDPRVADMAEECPDPQEADMAAAVAAVVRVDEVAVRDRSSQVRFFYDFRNFWFLNAPVLPH